MYEELYQYLISHKHLALPGIGNFLLEKKSSENDFSSKRINPPVYSIHFQAAEAVPSENFFNWLSNKMNISPQKAADVFHNFSSELKARIHDDCIISWNGVGILSKGLGSDIKFKSSAAERILEKPVAAQKVIRSKAEHLVRVGEDQKTSTEMSEMLNQPDEKKSYWWAAALIVALLGFVFIGWYFSEHGMEISSVANTKNVTPREAESTYEIVR